MKIGNKVINYSVYAKIDNKTKYIQDTTNLQMPSFENLTDSIKGAGILGEIDFPTLAQVGSLSFATTFRNITSDEIMLYIPKAQDIEVRWAIDKYDSTNNKIGIESHKAFIKGVPKKFEAGKIEPNASQESTIELEVLYYSHLIDGKTVLEVDKLNNVFKVNGVDYASDIRGAL
jgi:P2 family phage contractile tail tube protein